MLGKDLLLGFIIVQFVLDLSATVMEVSNVAYVQSSFQMTFNNFFKSQD